MTIPTASQLTPDHFQFPVIVLAPGFEGDECEGTDPATGEPFSQCAEGLRCAEGFCEQIEIGIIGVIEEPPFIVGGPTTITCSADDSVVGCASGT